MSESLDPGLTHIIIAYGGYWGKAESLPEAIKNFKKVSSYKKVPSDALCYFVGPGTYIDEDGMMRRPRAEPAPALVKVKQ